MTRLDGMNHAARAMFARTALYGHREQTRNAAWLFLIERIAKGEAK